MLGTIIMLWLGLEAGTGIRNEIERHTFYNEAREYCNSVSKPLLRVGIRKYPWEPPNADYTVDIDPDILNISGGILADERAMPFSNKQFGACINQHTLEHLNTPEDVQQAVNECTRVSDTTILLTPSPYSFFSNVLNPQHNLRLYFDQLNNKIRVEENPKLGVSVPTPSIGAHMVIHEGAPRVYSQGRAIIIE